MFGSRWALSAPILQNYDLWENCPTQCVSVVHRYGRWLQCEMCEGGDLWIDGRIGSRHSSSTKYLPRYAPSEAYPGGHGDNGTTYHELYVQSIGKDSLLFICPTGNKGRHLTLMARFCLYLWSNAVGGRYFAYLYRSWTLHHVQIRAWSFFWWARWMFF